MCETGRCRIRSRAGEPDPPVAAWDGGDPWELVLELISTQDGDGYLLVARLYRNETSIGIEEATLLLRGGLVIANNLIAPLRHFGAFDLIPVLGASRRISVAAGDVPELLATLYALPHVPRVLLPPELAVAEIRTPPVARLAITPTAVRGWGPSLLECVLAFDYGGTTITPDQGQAAVFDPEPSRIIHRDPAFEQRALNRLLALGVREYFEGYPRVRRRRLKPSKLDPLIRTLVGEGWHVEVHGQLIRTAGALTAEVRSGIDWFDLDASVAFGDSSASLPALLAALERGDRTVALSDGSLGLLADDAFERLRSLAALGKEVNGGFRFGRTQVALLDTLLAAMPASRVDDVFERARVELRRFDRIAPSEAPAGFHGTLRPYQKEGLGWMHFLRDFGFGGCLADDMGLGKTVQLLALLEARRESGAGPSLVVVPKSLMFNWRQESTRFAPALRVLEYAGGQRGRAALDPQQHDLVLTTYGVLRRDAARLATIPFDYVVLDEAQVIKNAATAGAKAARSLTARHRLALTGTPVENRLGDLWSLFEFLNPGMLGAARALKASGSGIGEGMQESRTMLARALRPFILRRTKQQVAKDLPERLEQTIYVELESKERAQYDELRDHYRASLLHRVERDGMNKSRMHILEALLRLRQAACHPGLIDKDRVGESSSKLDVLVPRLLELAAEDHKTLVFSQFTSMLAILRSRLDEEGLAYAYLDGRTRDREARVAEFQTDPSCRTFLISLKAGGLGLNLTAAEYVFLLDPWWNPAVEAQAIDRAHRIGQTRRVFASRLIARDTVEEKVLELQRTKRELADAIITGDNASVGNLRREDLEALLS
jgi:superfamily II DNA or RNA helicase